MDGLARKYRSRSHAGDGQKREGNAVEASRKAGRALFTLRTTHQYGRSSARPDDESCRSLGQAGDIASRHQSAARRRTRSAPKKVAQVAVQPELVHAVAVRANMRSILVA